MFPNDFVVMESRQGFVVSRERPLWRVTQGALRIDSRLAPDACSGFSRIALAGDVVGIEQWAGTDCNLAMKALVPTRLEPVDLANTPLTQLLMDSVVTAHQRGREALELRTGPVARRIQALLVLFSRQNHSDWDSVQDCPLPHLTDMSDIVDAAPETVSRVFANLRGMDCVLERKRQKAKFSAAAVRDMVLVMGMTASPGIRAA